MSPTLHSFLELSKTNNVFLFPLILSLSSLILAAKLPASEINIIYPELLVILFEVLDQFSHCVRKILKNGYRV